jgi:predicted transposase/invertase (TIGR01784 family)
MQTTVPAGLRERLTYYVSSLYVSQLQEGSGYVTLRPAVSICVLDRLVFREVPDPHLNFQLREEGHGLVLTDHLQVHLLELPKYNPVEEDLGGASPLEKWLYFFRFAADLSMDEIEARLSDRVIREAAGVLEMISQTPRERELYEARLKLERDEAARLLGAREEGRQEGRQEGRREGRQEGKRLGKLIGVVQTLQQLLGMEVSTSEDLEVRSEEDLSKMVEAFQTQLRDRRVL